MKREATALHHCLKIIDKTLNKLRETHHDLELAELSAALKAIEDKLGRDRSQPKLSGRTLDIDILTYGDLAGEFNGIKLPRAEITANAFVLWPLAQICGKQKHPVLKQSFAALWEQYDKDRQKLWPVDFQWHGRMLSRNE